MNEISALEIALALGYELQIRRRGELVVVHVRKEDRPVISPVYGLEADETLNKAAGVVLEMERVKRARMKTNDLDQAARLLGVPKIGQEDSSDG